MWHILTLFFPRIQCDMKFHNCHQAIVQFQSCSLEEGPPTYRNDTQYITLNMRKNSGNSSRNRISNLACDISSRCFFLVKFLIVAFRSSRLPRIGEFHLHFTFPRSFSISITFQSSTLKYGSEEKGSSLCRCSILLGFIMSKNLRGLWFYLLIKVQNATSLVFLT